MLAGEERRPIRDGWEAHEGIYDACRTHPRSTQRDCHETAWLGQGQRAKEGTRSPAAPVAPVVQRV